MATIHQEYEMVSVIVATFLGGVINAMIIRLFADYYSNLITSSAISTSAWVILITYGVLVVILPIFLSFALTRLLPEKRIASPRYMNFIALAILMYSVYNHLTPSDVGVLYVLGFYSWMGGNIQDGIVTYTLGKAFSRDDIIRFSLKADANIDEIRTILMQPRFRDRLGITRKVKETNRGVTFKNSPKSDLRNIWELEGDPKSNVTFINLIAYERRRFDIKGTEEAEEDARLSLAYVKDLLQRSEYSIGVEQASLDHTEYLVNTLIDDLQGASSKMRTMSMQNVFKLVVAAVLSGVMVWLFVADHFEAALATLGTVIYILIEFARSGGSD